MSNLYINHFTITGNSAVTHYHSNLVSQLSYEYSFHSNAPFEFTHLNLCETFFPLYRKSINTSGGLPGYSELGCERAYIDQNLKPGNNLVIISINGVTDRLQDRYLKTLCEIDPHVVLSMYSFTGHQDEEWERSISIVNDIITVVPNLVVV